MRSYFVLKLDLKWISLLIALAYISYSPQSYIMAHLPHNNNSHNDGRCLINAISLKTRVFTWYTTLSYTILIVSCYHTQLEQLRAIKCKGDGSVRSGSCSHHIFKNIWSPAVHKGLHYHSNFDVPYVVVVLKKCLCLLYRLICPLDFFLGKWRSPNHVWYKSIIPRQGTCTATVFPLLCMCLSQDSWLSKIGGDLDQGQNHKIVKLEPPPSFLVYGTARTRNWNLATGSSQLT